MGRGRIAGYARAMSPPERARAALAELGIAADIRSYPQGTATAEAAAAAVGCEPGQIVKSLVFIAEGRLTLALVAGDRHVDTGALAALVGVGRKRLRMATAAEVEARTGYPVGGVAPVGSIECADVVVDESLRRFAIVWAAAGSEDTVFGTDTARLVEKMEGQWAAITRALA